MESQYKDNIILNLVLALATHVYLLFISFCHYLLTALFWGKKKRLPPIKNGLLLKSATEIAEDIRTGKITSEKVVQAYVDRIHETHPYINAVVDNRFERALEEARKVDALIASNTKSHEELSRDFPLLGVPITVKNFIQVQGMACTAGCLYHKDRRATIDADVVTLMNKAGAICLANTNTPEFGGGLDSDNLLYGRTNNPYDTTRSSGGSTGGEGALVGCAGSVVGLGNDLLGSIRIPAFINGTFGHKPSRGLISNEGMFPNELLDLKEFLSHGPLCRYAQDLVTTVKILAEPSAIADKIGQHVDMSKLRIVYMLHDGGNPFTVPLEEDLADAVKKVAHYFKEEFNAEVMEINIKAMKYGFKIWIKNALVPFFENAVKVFSADKPKVNPNKELLNLFLGKPRFALSSIIFMHCKRFCPLVNIFLSEVEDNYNELNDELNHMFDGNTVLLFPTMPKKAPYHKESTLLLTSASYTAFANMFGLPATQCPIGLSPEGLPIGLQVIGGMGDDNLTLACALEIEKAFGGWIPPS